MSWTTSLVDLRNKLSDNTKDKLRAFKKVLGDQNGTNKIFKTFEFRRLTDFDNASTVYPLGIYKNNVRLTDADVTADDPETGYFTLSAAPVNTDRIVASYYIQWFKDSELTIFLSSSADWLTQGGDITTTPEGLRPAALDYAASEAYQKLSLRWAEHMSETYRTEDAPDPKRMDIVEQYQQAAKTYRESAFKLRDDFYTRQGQSLQPLFQIGLGSVIDVPPRR